MIVRPKMLGRFDFDDFLWLDLSDAHISEDILGSTFTAKHTSGRVISISMLRKNDCRNLYQVAQHREEQAIEDRRRRQMEETAAGAAQVNVTQPVNGSATPDPIARMQKLKDMLDAELIDDVEFATRKSEILSEI